ncbi:13970_t:CDS:1, partial [Gigaspora margarita]
MSDNVQNTRDVGKDPQQISQPTAATNTGQHRTELSIDPNIKLYIDESIRAATTSVISSIKQYTDSLFDKQRLWNEQLQTNINNSLAQMVRSSTTGGTLTRMDSSSSVDLMDSPQQRQRPVCTSDSPQSMDKGKETVPASGKYPPTPVLNDLIARASKVSIQGQTTPATAPPTASAPMRTITTPA